MVTVLNTQGEQSLLVNDFIDTADGQINSGMACLFPGWLFWAGLIPVGLIAGLFYVSGYKTITVMSLGGYIALVMLASPQLAIYVFLAWQAWDGIFLSEKTAVFTPAKILAFVVLLSYALHSAHVRRDARDAHHLLITSFVFAGYGLLLAIVAIAPLATIRYSLQIVVLVLVVWVGIKVIDSPKRIRAAIFWLVVGGTLAAVAVITGQGSEHYSRGTIAENVNPNSIALALSVSLAAVPALWGLAKRKFDYVICIVCGSLLMAGMMKTGSRSACGGIFLAYAIGALLIKGHGWAQKITVTIFAILLSAGVFFIVLHLQILDKKSQLRLETMVGMSSDTSTSSGRTGVWLNAMKAYTHMPITGVGYGNTAVAASEFTGNYKDVHSSIIGPFVEGGIVGFLLFMYMLWLLFQRIRSIGIPNPGIPAAIMYAYILIASATHTIHFTKWFWIPVLVCLLLSRHAEQIKAANYYYGGSTFE